MSSQHDLNKNVAPCLNVNTAQRREQSPERVGVPTYLADKQPYWPHQAAHIAACTLRTLHTCRASGAAAGGVERA